jgi:maleate isomerase
MAWRVGLLIPSSNAVMEVDFYRSLPHDATLHVSRMYLADATTRGEERMLDRFMSPAAMALQTILPDVVVFEGGSAAAMRGPAYERALGEQIARVTGAVSISVRAAVNEALRNTRAARLAVVTPYDDQANKRIKAGVEAEGLTVSAIHGMGMSASDSAAVTPDAIYAFVQACIGPRVPGDALFVADSNFQAMSALSLLKITYDVAIVTSNLAALQAVKRQIENLRQREMARLSS